MLRNPMMPKVVPKLIEKPQSLLSEVSIQVHSEINECNTNTKIIQTFTNTEENNIELQIILFKNIYFLFDFFEADINGTKVISKVIERTKAEEKYDDAISSGNAAIFVAEDKKNPNKITINLGNIPTKATVKFVSNFINYTQNQDGQYVAELCRNFPIFVDKASNSIFKMKEIDVDILIKCNDKIKDFECDDKDNVEFKVIESKYLNEKEYSFKYKYTKIPTINGFNPRARGGHEGLNEYFKSTKFRFYLEAKKEITLFQQKHPKLNEIIYTLNIPLSNFNLRNKDEIYTVPSFFIFLIDQSGSMSGKPMDLVKEALKLFLHSIPKGSFYQLVGFGSNFEYYNKKPTSFIVENINETMKIIDYMKANKGGTDIYEPLKSIFDQLNTNYKNIPLSRNVILLTDGQINNRADTLNLIENNSNNFIVHSIGIGNSFDKLLIENAGKLGKGGYSFAENVENISEAVIKQVEKCVEPYIKNFKIEFEGINKENIILNTELSNTLSDSEILNYSIISKKEEKINKIKINFSHLLSNEKENNISKEYNFVDIIQPFPDGEDLTKLSINSYFNGNSKKLDNNSLLELSKKYQVLSSETCLFSEIELNEKSTEGMKKITNETKTIIILEHERVYRHFGLMRCFERENARRKMKCCKMEMEDRPKMKRHKLNNTPLGMIKSMPMPKDCPNAGNKVIINKQCDDINNTSYNSTNKKIKMNIREKDKDMNEKNDNNGDQFMKMIMTQDLMDGYWEENGLTNIYIKKYNKEYEEILKIVKDKNIAITTLIIYVIFKEKPEKVNELSLIIKKAKIYLKGKSGKDYENLIIEANIK